MQIARRPINTPPSRNDELRINEGILVPQVLLIDYAGEKRGVVPIDQALSVARDAGLDLVEVSPHTRPPVCKVLDYGKFKYQQQKKKTEAKKKQKVVDIKEIKMRPNIEDHDYQVKIRSMKRFFEDGDKVKVTLRFRGREMAHQDRGMELLKRVQVELESIAKTEQVPKIDGRQIMMVMVPR